ncbi:MULTISPECIES: triple tyrosine motif-containing protein [unclassified Pseudoxanthomonas]|uniref:sensor histidine kinase n=1 Tax=unclassified Pseudoxanthomonas TaxID=2645906 RepID=UPI003076A578
MTRSRALSMGLALLLAAGLSFAASISHAQMSPPGFERFKHVRAAADDGAPDGLLRIAQTDDGYLWLAGDSLYRFDGATFELVDWPEGSAKRHASPSALMAGKRGELWVGLRDTGGVAVYRDGALRDMHMPDPPRGLAAFAQTPDGTIWASSLGLDKRLQRLRGSRWERVDEQLKLPPGYIMDLIVARDGGLWIALGAEDGESGELALLAPGADRFRKMEVRLSGRPKITFDRNGTLWASDAAGTRALFGPDGEPPNSGIVFPAVPEASRAAFTFDNNGGLWGTTGAVGIFHIADPLSPRGSPASSVRRLGAANGLTSDITYAPFVDRENNVWITTESGIDQFRHASAIQDAAIPADPTHGLTIAKARDGSAYIASQRTLFHALPGKDPKPIRTLRSDEVSMCSARDGGVWLLERGRTLLLHGSQATVTPGYPGGESKIACTEDGDGRLWLGLASGKLMWRDRDGWHGAKGELARLNVWDLATTPAGYLALIVPPDVALLHGNRLETIRLAPTGIGTPWALLPGNLPGSRDLFVSGSAGLMRLRGNQLRQLNEKRFPWITWIRTLQQTANGETWLFSRTGAYKVATIDFDRAFDDPQALLPYTKLDALDGLASTVQRGGFAGAQSVLAGDGRIWFLNRQGAAFLDPGNLPSNKLAPPVTIRSLASGGRIWRDPTNAVLAAGTRTIDITYAGLSFTVPQRVRFKYKLEGVDEHWVDAGARRMVSYSNLGPGNYRFQVVARNNDGVWSRNGAALNFQIQPTFVESTPFRLLCAFALLALLWFAYSIRLRAVARSVRLRMAERIEERERIARELHDTLLQAIQALTLRFQLAVDDLPPGMAGRTSLIAAIDMADRVIADGRDRVRELRTQQEGNFEQVICDLIARTGFDPAVDVAISVSGSPRRFDPLALEEVISIAGEALNNVRQHAAASRVTVEIRFDSSFRLRLADDGVGIDAPVAENGSKEGHYGLIGMGERARKLRGRLAVRAGPDGGTEVVLTVPGSIAYKREEHRPSGASKGEEP